MMTSGEKAWMVFNILSISYFICVTLIRFLVHETGIHFYIDILILLGTIYNTRTINKQVEERIEREAWIRSLYI